MAVQRLIAATGFTCEVRSFDAVRGLLEIWYEDTQTFESSVPVDEVHLPPVPPKSSVICGGQASDFRTEVDALPSEAKTIYGADSVDASESNSNSCTAVAIWRYRDSIKILQTPLAQSLPVRQRMKYTCIRPGQKKLIINDSLPYTWENELIQLKAMGFRWLAKNGLQKHSGNIHEASGYCIQNSESSPGQGIAKMVDSDRQTMDKEHTR